MSKKQLKHRKPPRKKRGQKPLTMSQRVAEAYIKKQSEAKQSEENADN